MEITTVYNELVQHIAQGADYRVEGFRIANLTENLDHAQIIIEEAKVEAQQLSKKTNLEPYIGKYLPPVGETCFRTLDGSDVAAWLVKQGYLVTDHYDNGYGGIAVTADGFKVSTNGYVTTT